MKSKHISGMLANNENKTFFASSGGVAANKSSRLSFLISLATSLHLYSGFSLSPLFVSTHLTLTGDFPVAFQHSSSGTFS